MKYILNTIHAIVSPSTIPAASGPVVIYNMQQNRTVTSPAMAVETEATAPNTAFQMLRLGDAPPTRLKP